MTDFHDRRQGISRSTIFLIIGGLLVVLVMIIGGIGLFLYHLILGGPATVSRDINDYGKFEDKKRYSNLAIFPKTLPASARDAQYYYFYQDVIMDPTYQIYLEYSLSEADYQAEVERLANISASRGGETHKIVYDSGSFAYPAYVTIFARNLTYEYALLDANQHKIVYVLSQWVHRKDIAFDASYLPRAFQSPGDPGVDTLGGFNIYYFGIGNGVWALEGEGE